MEHESIHLITHLSDFSKNSIQLAEFNDKIKEILTVSQYYSIFLIISFFKKCNWENYLLNKCKK
jgi:hypothetical protein